jgi:hypothetical protein
MSDEIEPIGRRVEGEMERLRRESDLSFRAIDWGLDPNSLVGKSPEELAEHIPVMAEQIRRLQQAQLQIALRLGRVVDKKGDVSLSQEVDMIHNPDRYHIDYHPPEAEDEPKD